MKKTWITCATAAWRAPNCAEAYGWKRVPCTQGGAMRTRQAIHADVLRLAQAIVTEV